MDDIKIISALKIEVKNHREDFSGFIFGSIPFYCYDVLRNIFIEIFLTPESISGHTIMDISPQDEAGSIHLKRSLLVLPIFFYRDMIFSVDANSRLGLLKDHSSYGAFKEFKFSIEETFRLNNRLGCKMAKIINEERPDYSYIINNILGLKKDLLGAFHHVVSSACATPHKGKLEEEIKDKIESNII